VVILSKKRQEQLDAEKKQRQKEQAEKDAAAKKAQAAQDAEKNAAKAKAAAEKAERERLQNIQQNLSLEKELNGARIEMLEAGKDKEIAIENERNRAAVADLAFRKMQADTVEEEIKLGKLEELEKQQHAKKLLEIERNYIAEQMKLREDATAQFIELTKRGQGSGAGTGRSAGKGSGRRYCR
jgi:hypothetical protein